MIRLDFRVTGARVEPFAAVPTLVFTIGIEEAERQQIDSIMLRCQIRIEPGKRRYSKDEEANLTELFAETSRWADTVKPFVWTHATTVVQDFEGKVSIELPVTCTYDLEVAASKYFHSLQDGEISLVFLWSGTVFLRSATGFKVAQVPWDRESRFKLPVAMWRELMDQYFPGSGWLRLHRDTLDALLRLKAQGAFGSWDEAVMSLLGGKK